MKCVFVCGVLSLAMLVVPALAAVSGAIRGSVADPSGRPVAGASVVLKSLSSDYALELSTRADGTFEAISVPVGAYRVTVTQPGFAPSRQDVTMLSGSAPELHFQLAIAPLREEVSVSETVSAADSSQITPVTMVSRSDIAAAPGADLTNNLNAITTYVPGSWVTHDQLHVRGGHQVTWAIDGVPIPNTNIASNVGPQIDPKDIDYLEMQRGGYSAAYGDRTYGVFNVIPRTGFEGHDYGELVTTFGTLHQTNDQVHFGSHTDKFAYYASVNGNRSDYGLETPGPEVSHDRVWGLGGTGTIIYNHDANNQFRFVTSLRRDDYQVPVAPEAEDMSIRDVERERDALASFSWLRTLPGNTLLTVSPFYHQNLANYDGAPDDFPVSATQHRDSQYAGAQVTLSAVTTRHNATAGVYSFFQQDSESVGLIANDGSGLSFAQRQRSAGGLAAGFLDDQFKPLSWLTLTAGARLTHFAGAIAEGAVSPRVGAAVRIPHLNWTVRGFWGQYYQAPPLSTVSGPLLDFAVSQGLISSPFAGSGIARASLVSASRFAGGIWT
jgi:outer membrane receptor for ferrienterochelin and colicin